MIFTGELFGQASQLMKDIFKIIRQRRFEFHIFSGCRMDETKHLGVKHLPLGFKRLFGRAVNQIANQRMTDGCHVYANLMGTASFQFTFHIGIIAESL